MMIEVIEMNGTNAIAHNGDESLTISNKTQEKNGLVLMNMYALILENIKRISQEIPRMRKQSGTFTKNSMSFAFRSETPGKYYSRLTSWSSLSTAFWHLSSCFTALSGMRSLTASTAGFMRA